MVTSILLITVTFSNEIDDMKNDPSAVLQQYIPESYLKLQNEIDRRCLEIKQDNLAPMMDKQSF